MLLTLFVLTMIEMITALPTNSNLDSKTPYPMVETNWDQVVKDAQLPSNCQLIHLRVVFRHGTRSLYGNLAEKCQKAIEKIVVAGPKPVGISDRHLTALTNWKNTLPTDGSLLSRGKMEHRFHARNYFKLVNKSSPIGQHATEFQFESTSVPRAFDSGQAFRSQWVNLTNVDENRLGNVTVNDTRNSFYFYCNAFQTRVVKNVAASTEFHRAGTTKSAQAIIAKISRRLGISNTNLLTWDEVIPLYQMAGTEMAEYNSSALMVLFDEEDLGYLEYVYDLEEYWTTSYSADNVTREMGCILTNNIFGTAENAYNAKNYTPGMFTFAHSEVLQSLYGSFSLFYDPREGYRADASRFFYSHRNYDTSEVGKFASHMAFFFYKCDGDLAPQDKLVMMMVNGQPQPFKDACPYDLPCPLERVKKAYPLMTGFPRQCDYQSICSLKDSTTTRQTATLLESIDQARSGRTKSAAISLAQPNVIVVTTLLLHLILVLSIRA